MTCFKPIEAYRSKAGRLPNGRWPVVFNKSEGYVDKPVTIPCGKCMGCRLERSRQWAMRCVHEASLYVDNCFITLTYNNDQCTNRLISLNKRDFVLFMKRLRKEYSEQKIRFFHCGEYGEQNRRPHHHACLFNFDFPDKVFWQMGSGTRLFRSPDLERLWPFGYSSIGDVTFESAAYVARYICKKITGEAAEKYYVGRIPEYITMSNRPGIGADWYKQYKGDLYTHDFTIVRNGIKSRPAKYYDKKYESECNRASDNKIFTIKSNKFQRLLYERRKKANQLTREQLLDKEESQKIKFRNCKRGYESMMSRPGGTMARSEQQRAPSKPGEWSIESLIV